MEVKEKKKVRKGTGTKKGNRDRKEEKMDRKTEGR